MTFLAYHAYEMVHAIVLTLVRLVVTQRRLLEWETAAATAARSAGLAVKGGLLLFVGEMAASPLTAAAPRGPGGRRPGPTRSRVAAPILALWLGAPLIAYWLSLPVRPARHRLGAEDRLLLRGIARKTWRYFETFMGAADHGLPPDNFQETPDARRGAPDLAHQHRDGPAVDAGRPRPRLHPHRRAAGAARAR